MDLDGLIDQARERGARGFHLHAGRPPMLRQGSDIVPLESCPAVTLEEMRTLVERLLPPDEAERYWGEGQVQFRFVGRDGRDVECVMVDSLGAAALFVRLEPAEEGRAPARVRDEE